MREQERRTTGETKGRAKKQTKITFERAIELVEQRFGIVGVHAVSYWTDLEARIDWDAPEGPL